MQDESWQLTPFQSVGPLRFGMDRDEVIRVLGEEPQLRATEPVLAETFQAAGVNIEYDEDRQLLSVEGFDRNITHNGFRFLDRTADEVVRHLEDAGLDVDQEDPAGPDVPDLGLRLFVEPDRDGTTMLVTGVMAVREDYDDA